MKKLRAGAAKVVITPPAGTRLSGYAGRAGTSTGAHDDLYARALVLDDGARRLALLTCDLVGLSDESVARIRKAIEAPAGIPSEHVMVSCTHTHSGPATMDLRACGAMEPEVTRQIEEKAAEAVLAAAKALRNATIQVAYGKSDIGINRRYRPPGGTMQIGENPDGVTDPRSGILRISSETDRAMAILVNHACHAVVLGNDNLLASADFPGALCRSLEERVGGTAFFLQGCCGNINPRERGGFEVVSRVGQRLADHVLIGLRRARPVAVPKLRVASEVVELPLLPLASREEARKVLEDSERVVAEFDPSKTHLAHLHIAEAFRDWARAVLALHDDPNRPETTRAEVQVLSIGDVKLVGLPAEPFVELGLAIKRRVRGAFVLGYTNGNVGYVPTASAYPEGGYEVDTAYRLYAERMLAPGSGEMLVEAAVKLCRAC